jgi:hypothetical protein
MPAGELRFVGNKVLVPAEEVFCAVLMPHGIVLDVKMDRDTVDALRGHAEAYNEDYGLLCGCRIETMRADKYRAWFRRRRLRHSGKRNMRLVEAG